MRLALERLWSGASAHWCPITAFNERPEAFLVALVAAHRVGVDAEGEARIRVAKLSHDVRRILAADVQDRGECVAQLVGRHAVR